jgi:hypothetical protein
VHTQRGVEMRPHLHHRLHAFHARHRREFSFLESGDHERVGYRVEAREDPATPRFDPPAHRLLQGPHRRAPRLQHPGVLAQRGGFASDVNHELAGDGAGPQPYRRQQQYSELHGLSLRCDPATRGYPRPSGLTPI